MRRVRKVAPYLTADTKAVPAVVDMDNDPSTRKDLVWIIDGYDVEQLPLLGQHVRRSRRQRLAHHDWPRPAASQEINYIRNSIKAVVNAYDGSVTLYQWDNEDPIIKVAEVDLPGQITELSEMPGS